MNPPSVKLDPASLTRRRKEAGISQVELAKALSCWPETLNKYETGKRNIRYVIQLAIDRVLTEFENKQRERRGE